MQIQIFSTYLYVDVFDSVYGTTKWLFTYKPVSYMHARNISSHVVALLLSRSTHRFHDDMCGMQIIFLWIYVGFINSLSYTIVYFHSYV